MDPRLKPPPEESPAPGIDLDRTDELPIPDLRAYEASLREAAVAPRAGAEGAADPLQTAVANLREAQELLAGRGVRLAEGQRALEEAHSARSAAEQRVEQLTEARTAAERSETQHAADLAAARSAAGQREAELREEVERARAAGVRKASALAEELAASRAAAEQ